MYSKKEIIEFLGVTVLVLQHFFVLFASPVLFFYCLIFTTSHVLRILTVAYVIWMIYDRDLGHKGGRGLGWLWLRDKTRFDSAINYFPAKLVKTVDLPSDKNYLFAVFPHGLITFGVLLNFMSLSSKFWTYFPRMRPKPLILNFAFYVPFAREYVASYGAGCASARSIQNLLTQSNDLDDLVNSDGFTSNAVLLVVGGTREMMFARPGEYRLKVRTRKGFVKQAILAGTPLVPVFSFGEIDTYNQPPNPPGSRLRRWQEFTRSVIGGPIGCFNGAFCIIPRRKPITTVVGAPIEITKHENPPEEYINEIHEKFLDALTSLYHTHKHKYVPDHENVPLILE